MGVGCVHAAAPISIIPLNSAPRAIAPRAVGDVTIFATGAPTRRFVEVALVQSRREWGTSATPREIFERMRSEAAKAGCDGLVLLGEANLVTGTIWPVIGVHGPETYGTVDTVEGFRGVCIVWAEGDAAAPPR
jgi:hypothetical protein